MSRRPQSSPKAKKITNGAGDFTTLLRDARQQEESDRSEDEVIAAYTAAAAADPTRAEALHGAARYCRINSLYEQGYQFAERGLAIAYPHDAPGAEEWIYQYGLLDELAITAYWTERYAACVDACDRLLREGKLPAEHRDRVLTNKNLAVAKVIAGYTAQAAADPTRAEALHAAARYCRMNSLYEQGYQFAARGLAIAYPHNAPGAEEWIYQYGLLDELAVNAYWTERYAECADACERLLGEGKLPAEHRDRVLANKNLAIAKVIAAYTAAAAADPTRAEALHAAAVYCRNKSLYEQGYQFAARGMAIACPPDVADTKKWIYQYGLLDELAVNAYWTERYAECVDACDRLLREGKLPAEHHDRVLANKNLAIAKQNERDAAATLPEAGDAMTLLRAARQKATLGRPDDEVIAAYTAAAAADPTRAEALHAAAVYCRNKKLYEQGYQFAAQGLAIAHPHDAAGAEEWIYQYGLLDELAVNAYWTERYAECVDACDRLLREGKLPAEYHERVLANKNFAVAKQNERGAASSSEKQKIP